MDVSTVPPAAWDYRILSPVLSRGFADAMTTLGWQPFYASDESDAALVLIRRAPIPGLRGWTARAHVYVNHGFPTFVREVYRWLDDERVGSATVGDRVWPLPRHLDRAVARMRGVAVQRIVHDVQRDDPRLLADMAAETRAQVLRAERIGVVVSEIVCDADLQPFLALGQKAAAFPDAFFRTILRSLVPRGHATFLLAQVQGRPLAGGLFVNSARSMTYYHGVSTRDPALMAYAGMSALVWRAMRLARERKISSFDHGAMAVTGDRPFGGRAESILTGEVVLSRAKHALHSRVLQPAWQRLQPLYARMVGATATSAGWVVAFAM